MGRSWTIIQLMPDRSRTWPKREAKKVSCIGIRTWPPSERAANTLSASLSLSIPSERYALLIGSAFRDICSHEFGACDVDTRVQHGFSPLRTPTAFIGPLPMRHHHPDLRAEMLLVIAAGLGAFSGEVHVCIHLHHFIPLFVQNW